MDWEKIKNWIMSPIGLPISLVVFGFIIFWVISWAVFCYLGLELPDLRETVDSREMGGANKDKLIERAFTIIGGIVGGIIAVLGLFAVNKRLDIAEKQVTTSQDQVTTSQDQVENMKSQVESMEKQAKSMEMQAKISQKGQYLERFEKYKKQVKNKDLESSLEDLVSLDALSHEGEEEYRQVWKYLCNFLRNHKPLKDEGKKPHPKANAIAQMLRERNTKYEDEDFRLDLSKAHLEGADLSNTNLEGVNLIRAHLEGADLRRAYLEKADLREAHLEKADLEWADLREVHLEEAHLESAYLDRANLEKAFLWLAHLEGADLGLSNLTEAYLAGAHLEGADLRRTHLESANLTKADLRGSYLEGAILSDANLEEALFGGMKSGEPQDLTRFTFGQLRGTYYDKERPKLMLPEGISEDDKPKAISYKEWHANFRGNL